MNEINQVWVPVQQETQDFRIKLHTNTAALCQGIRVYLCTGNVRIQVAGVIRGRMLERKELC